MDLTSIENQYKPWHLTDFVMISNNSSIAYPKIIHQQKISMPHIQALKRNVRWEGAKSGQTFEVTNPATGEVS